MFYFQQDNDPKHTSKLCREYLEEKEEENVLKIMAHPPQSPDLNPIEVLWDELNRKVRLKCPTSKERLCKILQEELKKISSDTLIKLIQRRPRIVKKVKQVKGGFFDEKSV